MKIYVTLREVLERGRWLEFCKAKGFSEWAVNEGGGDVEVMLTLEEAQRFNVVPSENVAP
jgi:hypothetical protein